MKYPNLRLATALTVLLSAVIVSACSGPSEPPVPLATSAEISQHFSGNSALSDSGGAFYAENGDYKSYYYLPENLSEAPKVCTGIWRARDAKLVVKETCKSVSDGETVSSGPMTTRYKVYNNGYASFRLDEEREEPSTGKWSLRGPFEGFKYEESFTAMQAKIDAGKWVPTEGQTMLLAPLYLGYCALVGPACLII